MKRTFTKYPSNYVGAASQTSGAAMRKKRRAFATKGREDSRLLATDGEWELYTPESWEACVYLGELYSDEKARWATCNYTNPHYFDAYNKQGPIYIFVNKNTGEKYQSQPATGMWLYDARDMNLGKQALFDFLDEHPAFVEFFDMGNPNYIGYDD